MTGALLFIRFIYAHKRGGQSGPKKLDRRQFKTPECFAHAHFYMAEFRLNNACVCNNTIFIYTVDSKINDNRYKQ